MLKVLSLIIMFVCTAAVSFSQYPVFTFSDSIGTSSLGPNSREIVRKNGIIKTTVSRTVIKDGKESSHPSFTAYHYDKSGKLIKQEMLNKEGVAATIDTFYYDARGKLIRTVMFSKDGTVYLDWSGVSGVSTMRMTPTNDSISTDTSKTTYDNNGRITQWFYLRGSVRHSRHYYYDGQDRIERIDNFDKEGKKVDSEVFRYSSGKKGSMLEIYKETSYTKFKVTECRYNKLGQCVKTTRYLHNSLTAQEEFEYYDNGALARQVVEYNNKTKIIQSYNHFFERAAKKHP